MADAIETNPTVSGVYRWKYSIDKGVDCYNNRGTEGGTQVNFTANGNSYNAIVVGKALNIPGEGDDNLSVGPAYVNYIDVTLEVSSIIYFVITLEDETTEEYNLPDEWTLNSIKLRVYYDNYNDTIVCCSNELKLVFLNEDDNTTEEYDALDTGLQRLYGFENDNYDPETGEYNGIVNYCDASIAPLPTFITDAYPTVTNLEVCVVAYGLPTDCFIYSSSNEDDYASLTDTEIDFGSEEQKITLTFYNYLINNATYVGSSSTSYSITTNITNGTYTGDTTITSDATTETKITLTANTGYTLPTTIEVTNATYTYDSSTGIVVLSGATGDVTITAECVAEETGGDTTMSSKNIKLKDGDTILYPQTKSTLLLDDDGNTFTPADSESVTSLDTRVSTLETNIAGKQDSLTAGDNIAITDNTISVTDVVTTDDLSTYRELIFGTQTASTSSWTGVSIDSSIYNGKVIYYVLPYASTSTSSTLNLTLSDGSTTGALPLFYHFTTRITTQYTQGAIIELMYLVSPSIGGSTRTTGWYCVEDRDNTNTYQLRGNYLIKAKSAISAGHLCCGDADGYQMIVAGATFNINYPILYCTNALSANATSINFFYVYGVNLSTSKSGFSGTAYSTAYLIGTLGDDGVTFTIADDVFTCSPDDYSDYDLIPLGIMTSSTNANFYSRINPLFYKSQDDVKELASTVATKQDKLTAGDNITIENNVISATSGGSSYTLPVATSSTLGGIKVGDNLSITSDGVLSATGGSSGSSDYIGENILINSDMYFNQRCRPVYYGENKYGPDRWIVVSDLAGIAQETSLEWTVSVEDEEDASEKIMLAQYVEDYENYQGKTLTCTLNYKNVTEDVTDSMLLEIYDGVNSTTSLIDADSTSATVTATIDSSATCLAVRIKTTSEAINCALTFVNCKLEYGSVATPWMSKGRRRELSDCKRYFQDVEVYGCSNAPYSTTEYRCRVDLNEGLRKTPTCSLYIGSSYPSLVGNSSIISTSAVDIYGKRDNSVILTFTPKTSLTLKQTYSLTEAIIFLDAEIYPS